MSEQVILALIPAISTFLTVYLQTGYKKSQEEFKEQLSKMQKTVDEITVIGNRNNADIAKIASGTKMTESYRLEIDLSAAIKRGYRTSYETRRLMGLFESYQELGGNGYIEDLFHQFMNLRVEEEHQHE